MIGEWSERQDLNLRPLDPQSSALPGCATLRRLAASGFSSGFWVGGNPISDRRPIVALATFIAVIMGQPASAQGLPRGWASLPTQEELLASYPPGAIENHVAGEAVLACGRDGKGVLERCKVIWEYPQARGLGSAALSISGKFQVDMSSSAARLSTISIPIFFGAGVPQRPLRQAEFPQHKRGFERLEPAGPYWPEGALRAGVGGLARIDCRVAAGNRLKDCQMADDSPAGMDFVLATLKMAESGWMIAGPAPTGVAEPADGYWRFELIFPRRTLSDAN
jgi:hypothetical protein